MGIDKEQPMRAIVLILALLFGLATPAFADDVATAQSVLRRRPDRAACPHRRRQWRSLGGDVYAGAAAGRQPEDYGMFAAEGGTGGLISIALEEFAQELRGLVRDADDLVRCLTIEFEAEFGLGSTVIPVAESFEFAPPERPLRECSASDGDAHTRCLPDDAAP